jgi:acid phosphatase type 7
MTAELIDRFPGAAIFAAGDASNDKGTPEEYHDCVSGSWGRFKDRIYPVPGNHDYQTSHAYGYFSYFGEAAGDPHTGYYSFNLGAWHIVMLNSECHEIGGCQPGSSEETWLKADLAAWPARCTLAVIHRPLFVSGASNNPQVRALWQDLYDAGAEIVISGHEHRYEHFIPVDPEGRSDPVRGIQEIMVGTGGAVLEDPKSGVLPSSVVIIPKEYGIIKLNLHPTSYAWQFIPVEDGDEPDVVADSGQGTCH